MVKNLPANVGDATDTGLTPKSGRSLKEGMPAHSSILGQESPAGYSPWVTKSWTGLKQLNAHMHTHTKVIYTFCRIYEWHEELSFHNSVKIPLF